MRLLAVAKTNFFKASDLVRGQISVVHADGPDDALSILRYETFDLMVVDLTSSAEADFRFIRAVRTAKHDVPLVALTGSQVADRIRALSLGAADAVSWPADGAELRARCTAVHRRHKGLSQSVVQLGDLLLSLETREVRFANVHIRLTSHEYAVLELLVLRRGHIITKEMFLNHLYNGIDEPEMKIIDVFICKLRKKLSYAGCEGLITTLWGQGYSIRKTLDGRPYSTSSAAGRSGAVVPGQDLQIRLLRDPFDNPVALAGPCKGPLTPSLACSVAHRPGRHATLLPVQPRPLLLNAERMIR